MILQIDEDTFQTTKGAHVMTLKRSATNAWEMMTTNPSTRAYNRFPSIRHFHSLAEVEQNYKSWFGITQLLADHTQQTLKPEPCPYNT